MVCSLSDVRSWWSCVLAVMFRVIGGRARWQRLMSTLPLFGALWQSTGVAEWSGLLSVLLKHEIPLPDALRLAGHGIRNAHIGHVSLRLADGVARGRTAVPADVFLPRTSLHADSAGGVGRAIRGIERVVSCRAGDV